MTTDLERRQTAQFIASQALAQSETIDEAIDRMMTEIGQFLGSSFGVFWLCTTDAEPLRATRLWNAERYDVFARATTSAAFARGEGLPGRAWQKRAPVVIDDATALQDHLRSESARRSGFRTAVAFPVLTRESFIGVIELYCSQPDAPGEPIRDILSSIGLQLGQFIARQQAVDRERAARRLSDAMVAASLDAIVTINHQGLVLEFNPAAERTFGFARAEILGKPMVHFIIPPELRDAHQRGIERYLATGESRVLGNRFEVEGIRANGERFPVELAIVQVDLPEPPVFTAYLRDMSEQKRLEGVHRLLLGATEILAGSLDYEETLRNLSRVVVPAFADWYTVDILDPNGAGVLRRLEVAHRDNAKVSIAREIAERFPEPLDQPGGVNETLRTGECRLIAEIPDEYLLQMAQNDEHLELLRQLGLHSAIFAPLRAENRVVGAITLVTAESGRRYDRRDREVAKELARRAGQAIEKARLFAEVRNSRALLEQQTEVLETQAAELEEAAKNAHDANRAKSDFLAAMSHELRTPLNAIMGYAQLLELGVHGQMQPKQLEDLRRIDRSAQHLLGLITDILNFAKIEAGRLEYRIVPMPLDDIVARVEEFISPQAAVKHIRYELLNTCGAVHVCADAEKATQVLVNLASNAVRYTSEGGTIFITCRATEDKVFTEVRDTGVGIPSDKLQAIFEPFVQVDRRYAGQRQGTGLGLAISRDLARGMGGDLTVRSEVGKGSVFTLTLRRDHSGAAAVVPPNPPRSKSP